MVTSDHPARRLVRAGILVGISDGLFATAFSTVMRGSFSATRVWLGVASVLIGKRALEGGYATAALGLLMHFTVAFTWSALFLLLVLRSPRVRAILDSPAGALKVATVLGPLIWVVMSIAVIPLLVQRPPTLGRSWVYMLIGHIFFVGLPMAWAMGTDRPHIAEAGSVR